MDATETGLWRTIGASLALAFGGVPGSTVRLTPTGWAVLTGEPVADVNWFLVDAGPAPDAQFRDFGGLLQSRDLPGLALLTESVAAPLGPVARELGFQAAGRVPLMVYRPLPNEDDAASRSSTAERFRVERVTAETLGEANRLAAETFGVEAGLFDRVVPVSSLAIPGVALFLARDGAHPVSTVTTLTVGSTVGIWTMATTPARQRQGAGRAVLEHALTHHRTQGVELCYLLATEAGKPLYERAGFRTLAEPAVWVRGTSVQVAHP